MSLYTKINDQLKQAQKAKDSLVLNTLRMLVSAIKYQMIATKQDLTDAEITKIVMQEAKKRKDAVAAFVKGGRPELAAKENEELSIIQQYLPQQLSEEELTKIIQKVIAANPGLNFGPLMGKVMAQASARAEGNTVQKILKIELSK